MKAVTIALVLVSVVLGILTHSVLEEVEAIFWLWVVFSVLCIAWGALVQRRLRSLGWACLVAGVLQVVLLFVLPAFATAKTKASHAVPNERASLDAAFALSLAVGCQQRRASEPGRSARHDLASGQNGNYE